MRRKKKKLKKIIVINLFILAILINGFAYRLYLYQFDLNEALRFIPDNKSFSYEPIMASRILMDGTEEDRLYKYFKPQIQNYGDLIYLTHLYTNKLWAEFGGIELPGKKDQVFLVLRYIFHELKIEEPVISEEQGINDTFFRYVDEGFLYGISDIHEDHLMAHRIFHDLDYWKFNNHVGITKENTTYFNIFKSIPDGSLEGHKKRNILYRRIQEPK